MAASGHLVRAGVLGALAVMLSLAALGAADAAERPDASCQRGNNVVGYGSLAFGDSSGTGFRALAQTFTPSTAGGSPRSRRRSKTRATPVPW